MFRPLVLAVLALLALLPACITTEQDLSGMAAAKRQLAQESSGWTTEFLRRRLIVADQVHIEGPVGLREHLATRVDPALHARVEKTIPEGYLQRYTPREGTGATEMGAFLDKLEIHAVRELVVLERPGPVNVRVRAAGDVYYVDIDAGEDQRVPALELVGHIQR